ncbi:MAG: polysaccharide pyruvyl transferase family protein [Microcoleaceae cyanobacterium MO_207.B10]|nr:polysaccharide pyruvyl transferase family protein [Microcoleaceae cyanobacterium MO_207.B10]
MKRVLICGFYGSYNLSDEAMLAGMINLLRSQSNDLSMTVFSNDPPDTKKRFGVDSISLQNSHPNHKIKLLLELIDNRYFILGGGDLLRDTVKTSIAKTWLNTLQQAIRFRHQTMILGISVGEIFRSETKALIPKVLNQVNLIGVRDTKSKLKLQELGVTNTIHVMSDLALEALPERGFYSQSITDKKIHVGISVSHLKERSSNVDVNLYPTFQKEIAAIADFLVEKYAATVHFLPFRTYKEKYHPTDDDYVSALDVLRYSRYANKLIVHRYFSSLQDFNIFTNQLDLMIGTRLHSLILTGGLGIPVIAAEYDVKVAGFMEEIGQKEYSISLQNFKKERIIPIIEKILDNPYNARKDILAGINTYREKTTKIQESLKQIFR